MKDKTPILIIEDNQKSLQVLTNNLGQNFQIYDVSNSMDAITLIRTKSIKITILSVYEPIKKGLDALRIIKERNCDTNVVLLANLNNNELAKECANLNVCGYMEKPFDFTKLKEKIVKLTRNLSSAFLQELWKEKYELKISSLSYTIINAIIYIENNFHRDFSRNELSKHLNINPDYLSRLFNKECGVRLKEYISRLRIYKCKRILSNQPNMKIKDVAKSIGMKDVNYFCRFFKKHTTLTPGQFKNIAFT